VRLIVLHTAEGARTIEDLGHFFQNSANQVSSHTGADNQKGKVGEYVKPGNKSWTCAAFNPVAVQIELCAFASWSRDTWMGPNHVMLENCAAWIAEEAARFGLPITKLSPGQAQGSGRGVCQHRDLGASGSGHSDCGDGFPIDYVLDLARGGTPPAQADTTEEETEMFYLQFTASGDATVVVPNYYADGKARFRMGSEDPSNCRVNIPGEQTQQCNLSPGEINGVQIPEGRKLIIVRRDTGQAPIAACFSR
jgi:hypothetical protein